MLGIWARTVHSSHDAAALLRQQRQADEQLLAVEAQLQALAAERRASGAPVPAVLPDLTGLGVEGAGPIVSVSVEVGRISAASGSSTWRPRPLWGTRWASC